MRLEWEYWLDQIGKEKILERESKTSEYIDIGLKRRKEIDHSDDAWTNSVLGGRKEVKWSSKKSWVERNGSWFRVGEVEKNMGVWI